MRQNIEIEEMRSGEDDGLLWVSLGFKSELSEYDVLFIVCGKVLNERERERRLDGLYFERFDQINSCCNGAENISVYEGAIDIDFTAEGSRELKLPRSVSFKCVSAGTEFRDAREVLRKMAKYEWAQAIQSA